MSMGGAGGSVDKYTYYKEFKSNGPMCGFAVFFLMTLGCLGVQIWAYTEDDKDK